MKDLKNQHVSCPYEVGDGFFTKNSMNPEARWPGTKWEQIKDMFILAAGDNYKVDETGGEAEHMLSIAEMPKHGHRVFLWTGGSGDNGNYTGVIINPETNKLETASSGAKIYHTWKGASFNTWGNAGGAGNGGGDVSGNTGFAGASAGHNNMPPYLVRYYWERTA